MREKYPETHEEIKRHAGGNRSHHPRAQREPTRDEPRDPEGRARLAYTMGFKDTPSASALTRFEERHGGVLRDVRGRFERLFYRPMIESLSDGAATRLSEEALKERLMILGFRDVKRSARTLHGLVSGTSRLTKLFRVLTPALLRHLARTPLPDEGLFGFLTLGEAVESRLDTLAGFRDRAGQRGLVTAARRLGGVGAAVEVLRWHRHRLSSRGR